MTITHIGKIGRLHKCTRDQLGHRIEDGEPGKDLVQWLNDSADVQKILKEQFGGRAITEQNLSEWRQTGHPEWLRQEETHLLAASLTEQSDDLNEAAKGQELSDRFASVLAMEMARLATLLMDKETDPEKRWQRLCQVSRELSRLRRDDHRATRMLIERQRWQRQMKSEDEESDKRQPSCRPRALTRRTCGRGDEEQTGRPDGQISAEQPNTGPEQTSSVLISAIRVCPEQPGMAPVQQNPGESRLIQPDTTTFPSADAPEPEPQPESKVQDQTAPEAPLPPAPATEPQSESRRIERPDLNRVNLAKSGQIRPMELTGIERIALLPLELQEVLNLRLFEEDVTDRILAQWLNNHRETQRILWINSCGNPICERDIFHWREFQLADKKANGGGPVNDRQPASMPTPST